MTAILPGFECEFTEQLPNFVRSLCPICLLILRDPYQVTCCGKSFCAACIQRVQDSSQLCPTCKQGEFELYPDKGLKQELHSFRVYCCNKTEGCDWQGELGQLDQHLNLKPDEDEQLTGCGFSKIKCLYCFKRHRRYKMDNHQSSLCLQRPFTCSMCEDYESTYDGVTNRHAPVCECRPVQCPNSCGDDNLQHQHLKKHLSGQCPLSLVECEFSNAGCDVELCRKDLPSHLSDSMVTHMSLLAKENRNLRVKLAKQAEDLSLMYDQKMDKERDRLTSLLLKQTDIVKDINKKMQKHDRLFKFRKKVVRRHMSKMKSL